jgi:3-hydroxyacyl-[acyl-carrier-protein] dehydratase
MKYLYPADYIGQRLPHKYPMLLVDRIVSFQAGQTICCMKNVTQNEEFFVGHFPQRKIMPGVLICEALAQTCALFGILDAEAAHGELPEGETMPTREPQIGFLAGVNVKFLRPVTPGDQLLLTASATRTMDGVRLFDVEASVDREIACKGNIKVTARGGS